MTPTSDASDAQREARRKSDIATLNEQALVALRATYPAITLPESLTERSVWRATKHGAGHIAGMEHLGKLQVVATNGLLAWYLRRDLERYDVATQTYVEVLKPFLGHVTHFDGDVEPLYSASRVRTAKPADGDDEPKVKRMARATSRKAQLLASL